MKVRTLFKTLILTAVGVTTLTGCGGEETEPTVIPGCRLNSDCPIDQICEEGVCVDGNTCIDGYDIHYKTDPASAVDFTISLGPTIPLVYTVSGRNLANSYVIRARARNSCCGRALG